MNPLNDLTGQRFTRLQVVDRAENRGGKTAWLCRCDCGNLRVVIGRHLVNGHSRSCSCLQKDKARERALSGEFGPERKLSLEKAEKIRLLAAHGLPQPQIAKSYNVTRASIADVVKRKYWLYAA